MSNLNFKLNLAAAVILSAFMLNAANAVERADTGHGAVATDSSVGRDIALKPATKHINVTNGETVAISAAGKTFSWHVNTLPNGTVLDLSRVAPQGLDVSGVKVYVAANPLYL